MMKEMYISIISYTDNIIMKGFHFNLKGLSLLKDMEHKITFIVKCIKTT